MAVYAVCPLEQLLRLTELQLSTRPFPKKRQTRQENPPAVLIQHWPRNDMGRVLEVKHLPIWAKSPLHHDGPVALR